MSRISDLVALIKRNIETVDNLVKSHGVDYVINDYVLLNAVLHMLQVSIQSLIDIGSIILSQSAYKVPSTYSEIPKLLVEIGALGNDDAELFLRMISFRNIVVNQYSTVSLELVRRMIKDSLHLDILRIAEGLYEFSLSKGIDY